jgi:hypothetical protein
MVNRSCPNCGEIFSKKSTYDYHINRKRPCVKKNNLIISELPQTPPELLQTPPELPQNISNIELCNVTKITNDKIKIKEENNNTKFCCSFCFQYFVKKYGLDRHLNGRCKFKREDKEEKEEKDKKEQKKQEEQRIDENQLLKDDEKYNLILKRLIDLENENKKLKNKIKKTNKTNKSINKIINKTTNINLNQNNNIINQNNNVINQNNILINFNDLKLENVDKKLFTNPLLNPRLLGKMIILQMIENVYINNTHPEYQNILITDKNRGYVKIYNNGKWKTDNIEIINIVIDGIISHSKNILVELKQEFINNVNAKTRLNTSEKYINLCDLEYLGDLEDEQVNDNVNNKDKIKRCKNFREMVYKDTINLFHDNKKLLLK